MQEIILKYPDDFTEEQVEFIKRSALLQIEAEINKTLYIPKEQIDAAKAKIDGVKSAMGIIDKVQDSELITTKG